MKVNSNCISFTLSGTEIKVELTGNYSHIWVENLGTSTIKMSRNPNIENQDSGVIQRPPNSSCGMEVSDSTIYIFGESGIVNIIGTNSAENPFKIAGEGGDNSSTGITYDEVSNLINSVIPVPTNITTYHIRKTNYYTGGYTFTFKKPFSTRPTVFVNCFNETAMNAVIGSTDDLTKYIFRPIVPVIKQGEPGTVKDQIFFYRNPEEDVGELMKNHDAFVYDILYINNIV